MKTTRTALLTIACAFTSALVFSQQTNQNSVRKTVLNNENPWEFSAKAIQGYIVNSHSIPGVNRTGANFTSQYYFGNVGLGITGGIMAGHMSNDAVKTFLSDRNYPSDATITKSNPSNSYLLFGPAVRFGNKVQFGAEINGGLFLINTGSLIVTPQGSPRPIYSMENGDKNLFPGFSGNIHIDYPINSSTRFFISTGYLQTKSSNRIIDLKQGIDIPRLQNQDVKLFTAGIGIKKSFGGRKGDKSDGLSAATGRGRRNTWGTGAATNQQYGDIINMATTESCGPVTQKTTNPDGTVTETTFACPEDAAKYNNAQGPDQFPWHVPRNRTSGEKVGNGLQSGANPVNELFQKDTVSNNILFGKVSYWPSAAEAIGIVTNKSSGIGGNVSKPGGMTSSSYAAGKIGDGTFKGGPGTVTLQMRADGSTKSAGNTQYQLVYSDDSNSTLANADISVNPLYQSTGNSGDNPLFEANNKSKSSGGGDLDRDGIPELMVSLIDPANGAVLATTNTEANGDFYFANLPTGTYAVKIEGELTQKKGYDVNIKKKMDIAGNILSTNESWTIELNTAKGTAEQAAAYVQKTRTKSNNSNDRLMGNTNDNSGLVWSPRSNFTVLPMAIADVDRDGLTERVLGKGASLLGGALGSNFASRPGNPIGGIIVKGGKNPGGSFFTTTTNNNGEFEFPQLKAGNYTITVEQKLVISDETDLQIGEDAIDNANLETGRKGWDGTVKGGSKTSVQDHNSSRSNKTSSLIDNDSDNTDDVVKKGWDPAKKESIQRSINTGADNLKSITGILDQLVSQITSDNKHPEGNYKNINTTIQNLKLAITDVQNTLNNLQQKDKDAAIEELNQKMSAMNMQFSALQNGLSNMGNQYSSISNVLKTKHDTAKNSINNVR